MAENKNATLIKDAVVFLPDRGYVSRAGVLFRHGRITAAGRDLKAPAGARVIDAQGACVTPGLIDGHTHIGLTDPPESDFTDVNETTEPVTPYLRVTDGINPYNKDLPLALLNGVTTVMVAPGSSNVFCGLAAIIKTRGATVEQMVVRDPAGMKMALGQNPKKCYGEKNRMPKTRMAVAYLVRQNFLLAREYREKRRTAAGARKTPFDQGLENLLAVLDRKIPARIHCHRADDILTALRLADEFSFSFCLEHASEARLVVSELAARKVDCFLGPNYAVPVKSENAWKGFGTAAVLRRAGVRFGITTDHEVEPCWFLPVAAGLSVRQGLADEDGLLAITRWPAEILGLADRLGSIAPGLDADLVVWERNPLQLGRPVTVFLNGEEVREEDLHARRQPRML